MRVRYWSDLAAALEAAPGAVWQARGYLAKPGSRNAYAWKRRYHVLRGTTIVYHLSREDHRSGGPPGDELTGGGYDGDSKAARADADNCEKKRETLTLT